MLGAALSQFPTPCEQGNASSPVVRLTLNLLKREEKRVRPDSNGIIPASRSLWLAKAKVYLRHRNREQAYVEYRLDQTGEG